MPSGLIRPLHRWVNWGVRPDPLKPKPRDWIPHIWRKATCDSPPSVSTPRGPYLKPAPSSPRSEVEKKLHSIPATRRARMKDGGLYFRGDSRASKDRETHPSFPVPLPAFCLMSPHFLNPRSLCTEAEHFCRNQPLGVQRKDQTESKGVCYAIISACLCLKFPLTQKFKNLKSINGRGFPAAQMAKNLAAITQIPSLG